jgi:hypothetical protein
MSALELLCRLADVKPQQFSREENLILEAELFARLYSELKNRFRTDFNEYFKLLKYNQEAEDAVLEAHFLRCIINDILTTESYTMAGIATYTQTPEDIIYEVATGQIVNPSFMLTRKLIDLHRAVRPNLYREVFTKAVKESS